MNFVASLINYRRTNKNPQVLITICIQIPSDVTVIISDQKIARNYYQHKSRENGFLHMQCTLVVKKIVLEIAQVWAAISPTLWHRIAQLWWTSSHEKNSIFPWKSSPNSFLPRKAIYCSLHNRSEQSWLPNPKQNFGMHDGIMTWKRFLHYWPFVRRMHRSPEYFPHRIHAKHSIFPHEQPTEQSMFDLRRRDAHMTSL